MVITSSQSRAGKTSVAILLARSLAMLGKQTLRDALMLTMMESERGATTEFFEDRLR